MPSVWDDALSARLAKLWNSHSSAEIAAIFAAEGYDVSRNAVIGRVHRMGLSTPKVKSLQRTRHTDLPIKRNKSGIGSVVLAVNRSKRAVPIKPVHFTPRIVDSEPLHLTLLELTDAVCKYECSGAREPDNFTFCGHPVREGASYCAKHAAICFEKRPPPKNKQKPFFRGAA